MTNQAALGAVVHTEAHEPGMKQLCSLVVRTCNDVSPRQIPDQPQPAGSASPGGAYCSTKDTERLPGTFPSRDTTVEPHLLCLNTTLSCIWTTLGRILPLSPRFGPATTGNSEILLQIPSAMVDNGFNHRERRLLH